MDPRVDVELDAEVAEEEEVAEFELGDRVAKWGYRGQARVYRIECIG